MPAHQTVREREEGIYGWARPRLGWKCIKCGRWFTKRPVSICPGVQAYYEWDKAAAAGLRTKTQWRAERRNLMPTAQPSGAMMCEKECYWLYAEDQTSPMRAAPSRRDGSNASAGNVL